MLGTIAPTGNEVSPACPHCGYSRRGIESDLCPECGQPCPNELIDLPSDALLPWERRIGRLQIWRFVSTIWLAWCHYPGYLRILSLRRAHAPYQAGWLAVWIALSALLIPFATSTACGMLYPEPIIRYGLSIHWARMVWETLCAGALLMWWLTLPAGLVLAVQVFGVAGIIRVASRPRQLDSSYYVAICSIAPVYFALAVLEQVGAVALMWLPAMRNLNLGDEDLRFIDLMPSFGVLLCVFLVVRIVYCLDKALIAPVLLATGVAEWWLFPFIYRVFAVITSAVLFPSG